MASPRAAFSLFKSLSPQKLQNVSVISKILSPKTPVRNKLTVPSTLIDRQVSPIFNIDTPHKKKIINEGCIDKHPTILGNGAFGTVYKARYKGEPVAAKIIKCNKTSNCIHNMEKETAFLRHSNIVKVLIVDEGSALTLITMELCGKSLQNVLEETGVSKTQRIDVWKSMAKALKYCHKAGVIHADIKPKNVLMGIDNKPKLADFGSAIFVNEPYAPSDFHGTPGYAAPEVVCGNAPTPLSDIYSLGTLAWQMLSRKPPFEGLHKHTILYLTGKGLTPSDYDLDDEFEGKYKDLYKKSWNKNYNERPNLVTIIKQLHKLESDVSEVIE